MTMKASERQVSGVVIIDLFGRITLGDESAVLRNMVRDAVTRGHKSILLNLAEVSYIDSAGIGQLVSCFTSVRNQGGDLKLMHLTKRVTDVLQITKLYTVFDIKDDEASAIAAFTPTRNVAPDPVS